MDVFIRSVSIIKRLSTNADHLVKQQDTLFCVRRRSIMMISTLHWVLRWVYGFSHIIYSTCGYVYTVMWERCCYFSNTQPISPESYGYRVYNITIITTIMMTIDYGSEIVYWIALWGYMSFDYWTPHMYSGYVYSTKVISLSLLWFNVAYFATCKTAALPGIPDVLLSIIWSIAMSEWIIPICTNDNYDEISVIQWHWLLYIENGARCLRPNISILCCMSE